jgi:protein SCO1/2
MSQARGERAALVAAGGILTVTVAWWALALWPVGGGSSEWLERVRSVCFGSTASGLPDVSGWMMLVGQPLGMFALAVGIWREEMPAAFRGLAGSPGGRLLLTAAAGLLVVGTALAGMRVGDGRALALAEGSFPEEELPGSTYPRLDQTAPIFTLVNQEGEGIGLEALRGRTVIVTFGFGHCLTLCPLQIHNAVAARARFDDVDRPALVVITLDPWRDTPSRLREIATQWGMEGEGVHVLSGDVSTVEAALDAWNIPRSRDLRTGDIVHPALVYVVDPEGRIAYALQGDPDALVELVRRASAAPRP